MYPLATPEEELKLKVAKDFFAEKIYDTTRILGRIDFCVSLKEKPSGTAIHFIWGEAKKGRADIYASLVQLILTIGKEKTFANELPPVFLCAFDAEKIAFLPYHKIAPFFDKSGFNWSVTPSNHGAPEFKALYNESKALLESEKLLFAFADSATHGENSAKNAAHATKAPHAAPNSAAKAPNSANPKPNPALKTFIKANLTLENEQISKLQITKDNFKHIYYKWLDAVAPSISIDWEAEKPDILSADFFLADLLSDDNITLKKTLRILLQSDFYKVKLEKRANSSSFNFTEFTFNDNGAAHKAFWRLYARPPKEDYWDYILERRDYLVPMDIRERKGAFFTPQIWVAKAQHYLANALNSAFEDCVIWDCAAGTGNLLRGLPQKPAQIYASTLDKADVEIMRELYAKEGALLENHIFEFDFLNDEFFDICDDKGNVLKKSPLPQSLQDILKKLQESAKKPLVDSDTKSPLPCESGAKSPPPLRRGVWGVGNEPQISEKSHRPLAPYMKEFSRAMRKNPTDAENKLWQELRGKKLGFSFRRQFVIDSKYIADFVCLEKRLIIECDGGQHDKSPSLAEGDLGGGLNHPDTQRDFYLESQNFRILRFWNNEILQNLNGVLAVIQSALNDDFANAKSTHPQTPSAREGALPLENSTSQGAFSTNQNTPKLIIFINPPYAEATSANTPAGTGQNKSGVAINNKIYEKYKDILGKASNEIFAQFFIRIQQEIQGCILASFSTLKYLNSQNFAKFRQTFQAEFKKGFMCPANTFDNVKGEFPIGFLIWNLNSQKNLKETQLDIFERDGEFMGKKGFYADLPQSINKWIKKFDNKNATQICGYMENPTPDFQNNSFLCITNEHGTRHNNYFAFSAENFIVGCVYYAVRHTIEHTWLNDRDQFLYPNDKWQSDIEFQTDCLAFTLFHPQNRISSKKSPSLAEGDLGGGLENQESPKNHFIPFDEGEIKAKEGFKSDFMYRFLRGKLGGNSLTTHPQTPSASQGALPFDEKELNTQSFIPTSPLEFSPEARAVFAAGRELWRHYHAQDFNDPQKPYNTNASLYDIKAFFQGFNEKGKMNAPQKATDAHYKDLLGALNSALRELAAKKIKQKIYDYGFLRE